MSIADIPDTFSILSEVEVLQNRITSTKKSTDFVSKMMNFAQNSMSKNTVKYYSRITKNQNIFFYDYIYDLFIICSIISGDIYRSRNRNILYFLHFSITVCL